MNIWITVIKGLLLLVAFIIFLQITHSLGEETTTPTDSALQPPQYNYMYDGNVFPDYNYDDNFDIYSVNCQDMTRCDSFGSTFPSTKCYCDLICSITGDCCSNNINVATTAVAATTTVTRDQFECVRVDEIVKSIEYGVHLVTKCSPSWDHDETKHLCENVTDPDDVLLRLPVSDNSDLKIMYRNMYCAQCNFVYEFFYWNIQVKCRNETDVRSLPDMGECSVFFIQPKPDMKRRTCQLEPEIIDTCNDGTDDHNCTHGQFYLMFDAMGHAYRNEYCAYCNGVTGNLTCEPPELTTEEPSLTTDPRKYSLQYLVDYNKGTVDDGDVVTKAECNEDNEVLDIRTNKCREIFCAPFLTLVNKTCVSMSIFGSRSSIPALNCTLYKLNPDEYELRNSSTLFILSQSTVYTDEDFLTNGTDVFICSDKYSQCDDCKETYFKFEVDEIGFYMTLVGSVLSIVALIITFSVYIAFPQLKNVPGKILICLVLALALAQLFFLIAPVVTDISSCCIAVAILVQYLFLSAFAWMNVIAIDLWMTFSNKFIAPGTGSSRSKRFMFYSLYAWLVPLVIVGISVIVNFVDIGSDHSYIKPKYGKGICWISSKYGLILFFVGPLGIFKIIDIISFIFTSIQIARARREGAMASQKNTCSLIINIKLSLVMGLTWVFAFIANATKEDAMWYIFIILNTLQGLFIAISFLCTKKVGRLLYAKYETISSNLGSATQQTDTG